MDKSTLSHFGKIVCVILIIAILLGMAAPFAGSIRDAFMDAVTAVTNKGADAIDTILGDGGMVDDENQGGSGGSQVPASCGIEGHYEGDSRGEHGIAASCSSGHAYTCECTDWVVPEGGTYTCYSTSAVYNSGETLPCGLKSNPGDIFTLEDYKYTAESSGWRVEINTFVTDKNQASYSPILESVNNILVTNMYCTFYNCKSLTTAPAIPNGVTKLYATFRSCSSLITAPSIPNGVTDMYATFRNCSSLTTTPAIPNSVTSMHSTFSGCKSLKTYAGAPEGTADGDFSGYVISNSVTNMYNTFSECTSLTTAPAIPNSVTNMGGTFSGCKSLTTAPVIPNSVTNMGSTFSGCVSLTGEIIINANPTQYTNCFYQTVKTITIVGDCTYSTKQKLGYGFGNIKFSA